MSSHNDQLRNQTQQAVILQVLIPLGYGREMVIHIKLFAHFRIGRFDNKIYDCTVESTVVDVLSSLKLLQSELGVILINGRVIDSSYILSNGDVLSIFPLIAGG